MVGNALAGGACVHPELTPLAYACNAETDVPLVAAACVYVAAKAEETAIHIKVVVAEARATFNGVFSLTLTFPVCIAG